MKAIQVKYLSATNHKPSRWKAFAEGGASVTLSYDYALNADENARRAAIALTTKMVWPRPVGSGVLPNGDYVFTMGA